MHVCVGACVYVVGALWRNYRKANCQPCVTRYNNSYILLDNLPMKYNVSPMFALLLCKCIIRKVIFSIMRRTDMSMNYII